VVTRRAPMTDAQWKRARAAARRFWSALSDRDRGDLGDALVLGELDPSDWIHEQQPRGFWAAVDTIRLQWECGS